MKYHPLGPNGEPNTKQPVRYGEKPCPDFCVPGSSDPLCKSCAGKKAKVGAVKKYSDAVWQGYQGEEIPNWSHIAGSKWNINASSKHQLAQLKAAATAAGGGAAVKAVVKKAAVAVATAEKTKAAAAAAVNRAEVQEERALTAATTNIVSRMRARLLANAAARPTVSAVPAAAAAAATSRRRSTRSSERRRRATRRSSGSMRGLPGTNRTATPNMISSPNVGNMSNWSSEGPAADPRLRRVDPVTGRAMTPERVALPAPRFKLPPATYAPNL